MATDDTFNEWKVEADAAELKRHRKETWKEWAARHKQRLAAGAAAVGVAGHSVYCRKHTTPATCDGYGCTWTNGECMPSWEEAIRQAWGANTAMADDAVAKAKADDAVAKAEADDAVAKADREADRVGAAQFKVEGSYQHGLARLMADTATEPRARQQEIIQSWPRGVRSAAHSIVKDKAAEDKAYQLSQMKLTPQSTWDVPPGTGTVLAPAPVAPKSAQTVTGPPVGGSYHYGLAKHFVDAVSMPTQAARLKAVDAWPSSVKQAITAMASNNDYKLSNEALRYWDTPPGTGTVLAPAPE